MAFLHSTRPTENVFPSLWTTDEAQAAEKKLSRAAKNSFVKKCEKDAVGARTSACEAQAADKKLAGAAKNSFVTKCVKDAASN